MLDTPIQTPRRGAARPRRRDSSTARPDTTLATLRLAPAARWVAEYYPVEEVRPARRRRLDVDLLVADPRWLTPAAAAAGAARRR